MKKTLFLFTLLLFTAVYSCRAQNYNFPYYRLAIPLFFHGDSGLSVQACYDMVDRVNDNFIASNLKISIYVGEVDRSSPQCPDVAPNYANMRKGGYNVYVNLCATCYGDGGGCYNGNIKMNVIDGDVLTHELGHALGLPHPAGGCVKPNWNNPGNYNDPVRLANCYDNSADCISGTDPNVGNWMNPGTYAPSVFTYCQHVTMIDNQITKISLIVPVNERYLWMILPTVYDSNYTHGMLSTNAAKYETPVPVLDLNYVSPYNCDASLKFIRPDNHTTHTAANYVTVTYKTRCPSGSVPSGYTFSTTLSTSLTETLYIPKNYGIEYIDYTFKTSASATTGWNIRQYVKYDYTNPPQGGSNCFGCMVYNGGGGSSKVLGGNKGNEHTITQYVNGNKIVYANAGFTDYMVLNMLGQNLATGKLLEGSGTIDIADLPPGSYIIAFYDGNDAKEAILFNK